MNLKMEFLQKMIEEVMQEKKILEFSIFPDDDESQQAEKDISQADESVAELIKRNEELKKENEMLRKEIEKLKNSEESEESEDEKPTRLAPMEESSTQSMKEDLFRIKKGRLKEIVIEEMKKAKDQGLI